MKLVGKMKAFFKRISDGNNRDGYLTKSSLSILGILVTNRRQILCKARSTNKFSSGFMFFKNE